MPIVKDIYTIEEAAKIACISKTLLYREIRSERLIIKKVGRRSLVMRGDLLSWLNSQEGFQPKSGGAKS
ncbi:MAG: excisionase family DNA binding protein [Parasphingorhabdus sp.]|jgi:excisionase family DNA binding protein|uniref:helix-turn-helix domain-containing protein n=1 Tax=Parasphingorhabdus sp. TaxID=2709688 RepID=UPI0039E658E6